MTLAFDLGKTYSELTEMISVNELSMWIAFYAERNRISNEANGDSVNLANKSSADILKGFGL